MGDYIIQGVEGEFYPCKPGIFLKTYDLVLDSSVRFNPGCKHPRTAFESLDGWTYCLECNERV